MQRYGATAPEGNSGLAMDAEEIINYLRGMDHDKHYPLQGVLSQTEAIGDPAQPTKEQSIILNWLGEAIREWEERFPLEEPLAGELRRLRPLLAAVAVTDAAFFTPGAHPLHQLLDTIQVHAIGWQPRLGRVGQAVKDQVCDIVEAALGWFESPTTELLDTTNAKMAAEAAKARARAGKMAQRVIEAERGRIRIAEVKHQAAQMINEALEQYRAPAAIGQFLQGPWYDSAQLVLLKSGQDSPEWKNMTSATSRLLESLQDHAEDEAEDPARRQHLFEFVSQFPRELRRCLLSIQHDRKAIDEAVDIIETHHTMVLRKRALELEDIAPLPLAGQDRGELFVDEDLGQVREGQWFILDTQNSPDLRATLVLRLDEQQQLLFANQAGIKVLQKSFTEFAELMNQGKVTQLDAGASFSRSLASCAGVVTQDDVDELTGAKAQKARQQVEQQHKAEQERARQGLEQAALERAERERKQREEARLAQLQREHEETQRVRQAALEAERLRQQQAEQERHQLVVEQEQARELQRRWEELAREYGEARQATPRAARATRHIANEEELVLPEGTWLGFRDRDETILARLAVFNREQDHYIFVDRFGVKLRQLRGEQLMLLIARGLVDILESRFRFREEVTRAQQEQDAWWPVAMDVDIAAKGVAPGRNGAGARQQPGLALENTVYIELASPDFGSNAAASIVRCTTCRVSGSHLWANLDQALAVGSTLQVAVELPAAADTLYLVGEVRWCHPLPGTGAEPGWRAELALHNADDSDIRDWVKLVASLAP